jgi:hypothetical protein
MEKINKWDAKVFSSRSDQRSKKGHVPGSPDNNDLAIYRSAMEIASSSPISLVMGMTLGLREVLCDLRHKVTCLEISDDAIDFLGDGIPESCRKNETIVKGSWLEMSKLLDNKYQFILGDGVFPNILEFKDQELLIREIRKMLLKNGKFLTRACLVTKELDLKNRTADILVERFRAGEINSAEFGHSMRIWGCYEEAYDQNTYLLDNRIVYQIYEEWFTEGRLTKEEHDIVNRQFFGGHHFYPPESYWEKLLTDAGFGFKRHVNSGFIYYAYLPIYECTPF